VSGELVRAAREALAAELGSAHVDAAVGRVTVEVEAEGRTETVTLSLRHGRLLAVSSDGRTDGPHVRAALQWVAGDGGEEAGAGVGVHVSDQPPASTLPGAPSLDALADAIDDLLTAVVRLGTERALGSPSFEEGVERLVRLAPSPLHHGMDRWIGRVRLALAERDLTVLSRLLDGASRVVGHLRSQPMTTDGRRRLRAWFGPTEDVGPNRDAVHERIFVELAREWSAGRERGSAEVRYLVDPQSGETFREVRRRGTSGSVGPCPRQLFVGLAELESEAVPRCLRLFQYTVSPIVTKEAWSGIEANASRDFLLLAQDYRAALKAFPALAEPFAIVRPAECRREEGLVLLDASGHPLSLARARDPGAAETLEGMSAEGPPRWVAGRLVDAEGALLLAPFGAAWGENDRDVTYRRLR